MSTRKIKNAVNNTTGELIYFKGHAQATYMSDGGTVEDAIKNIKPDIDLSDYVKSEELEGYAKTSDIPSLEGLATEEFVISQGYLTEIPSDYVTDTELNSKGYATKTEVSTSINNSISNIEFYSIKDNPIVDGEEGTITFVDETGNIGLKVLNDGIHTKDVIAGDHVLSNKMDNTTFKTINGEQIVGEGDITISGGNEITESTIADWGFTKNKGTITGARINGTYDITSINGNLLFDAVTDVKMNGSSKLTPDGTVDLGTVITSHQDITGKQDKLVSGTNIKTINGKSILGSGDITIEGGSGNNLSNVQAVDEISTIIDVDLDKYIVETTDDNITLENNKYYKKTNVSSNIIINLNMPEDNTVFTSFSIEFTTSSSGTSVSLPNTIKWLGGELPTFENDFTYQISICNGLGVCAKYA